MHKLGEVREPNQQDFDRVKELCLNNDGWTSTYSKSNLKIWTKKNDLSSFNMFKIKADLSDVSADLYYEVSQDNQYRLEWEKKSLESFEICYISSNSVIRYSSVKFPKPFKNRDFVNQRSWQDLGHGREKIVFNHSVNHAKCPIKKGFVRGLSFLSGCYIVPTAPNSCTAYFFTQVDLGGVLPSWLVNKATKSFKNLNKKTHKACLKYEKWKSKHNPTYKPWTNAELYKIPPLDRKDILEMDLKALKESNVDESQIKENEMSDKSDSDND